MRSPAPTARASRVSSAGLDLSRQRLDVHVLDEEGRTLEVTAVHPDADALRTLAAHVLLQGQEVTAAARISRAPFAPWNQCLPRQKAFAAGPAIEAPSRFRFGTPRRPPW
jgi:hypothetical protein